MSLRNRFIKTFMAGVLGTSAWLARRPALNPVTSAVMRAMARTTIRARGLRPAATAAHLGQQWQRAFPSAKQVPIRRVDGDTVFAEIHTPCPLRGTGDVHACWRMMEYDREVLRHAGGEFVVLRSQAEPGRTHCEVAMRLKGRGTVDLVAAHQRKGEAQ